MSEGGFGFPFGGDPEDLLRGLREFAEQQAESVQETQREQFATLTLNTAVELTAAALGQLNVGGGARQRRASGLHARAVGACCSTARSSGCCRPSRRLSSSGSRRVTSPARS